MEIINGGICAAKGFTAGGVHCGIRKNKSKRDLALIFSEVKASAAAVYTTNLVKGAPLAVTKMNLADGKAQAVICNSGNANTCNANGIEIAADHLIALRVNAPRTNFSILAKNQLVGETVFQHVLVVVDIVVGEDDGLLSLR